MSLAAWISDVAARRRGRSLDLGDPAILRTYVERFRIVFRTRLISVVLVGIAVAACGAPMTAAQFLAVHLGLFALYIWAVERAGGRAGASGLSRTLKAQSAALSAMMACHTLWLALHMNAALPHLHAEAVVLLVALFVLNGLQVHLTGASFMLSVAPPMIGLMLIGLPAGGSLSAHLWGGGIFFVAVLSAGWRQQLSDRQTADANVDLSRRNAELERAAAAADAANQAKSEFLANMSHEIRTPMNGVVAIIDLLSRADLPPAEKEKVEVVRASADSLQRLLSDILDLARIESGKIELEVRPFHLGDMVRATAALSQLRCDEKGVRLDVSIATEADRFVEGDLVRVRQVLTNLLSNAAKFTEAGVIRVDVEGAVEDRVRFTVTDTGVGFDPAVREQLLRRFAQADVSITRRFGGAGLGLAISSELVGMMHGVLGCDGRPGEGASFWFEIPLAAAEGEPADTEAAVAEAPQDVRILLADDHPTNRRVVELMLDGAADMVVVENGAEAMGAFETQAFDLVLMDMQMPVMDGLAATRSIRCIEAATGRPRTPVIMLTANALPEHVAAALEAGADRHLSKPITAATLFEAIGAALSAEPKAAAA